MQLFCRTGVYNAYFDVLTRFFDKIRLCTRIAAKFAGALFSPQKSGGAGVFREGE